MFGVPAEKSCRIMVRTTLVPCWRAVLTSPDTWLEFHSFQLESAAKLPSVWTWRPNTATVLSSEKFQLG